uniref:Uncharacterized protein n=1 Tax=Anguilla anguilla TaxID=7936 RepID=A0A0E9XSK0_ANGAN
MNQSIKCFQKINNILKKYNVGRDLNIFFFSPPQ